MGSRANVILAITKKAYVASVLKEDFPVMLKAEPKADGDAMYWSFEQIFWDRRVPEVAKLIDYLSALDDENEEPDTEPTHGGVELWDEGMSDTFGDPSHFGIWVVQHIESPFDKKESTT